MSVVDAVYHCALMDGQFDNRVRLAIYDHFVTTGRAPVAAEIASEVGALPHEVEDAYRRLADAHVLVLAPGTPYIWMANPFSALPTPFVVTARGRDWWANCIWDALGILAMFDTDGIVKTSCPDCADPIELEVRAGELVSVGAETVHFSVPAANWWDDIGFN